MKNEIANQNGQGYLVIDSAGIESVISVLKEFQEDKLIEVNGSTFTLLNEQELGILRF
ncbi:MAG: hypothetical protein ACJAU0_001333 [Flavobacteriales bacterium]|jgi:hypothetical protein